MMMMMMRRRKRKRRKREMTRENLRKVWTFEKTRSEGKKLGSFKIQHCESGIGEKEQKTRIYSYLLVSTENR